jgi:hypothetical protein
MVLIADADAERGRKIAAACAALSIEVRRVSHGAAALEVALAENPVAMVAQIDLPLIDGTRLAEILHANPHTCSMAMLFVGGDSAERDASSAKGAKGQVVPGHADPDTIARFVQVMLQKRRPEPLSSAAGGDTPGVEGKLSQIALSELIELFHVNRKTGVIALRQGGGRRAESGRIQLREGDVVAAQTGGVEGEKALFRLLAWRRGGFVFREEDDGVRRDIERPTRALLREAQRQAEEWERLGPDLPARQARVSLRVGRESLPNVLHPLTQEVLIVLELSNTVNDVLDRVSFPDYQVLRTLQMLIRRGLVEVHAASAKPETPTGALFAPQWTARLRDWLEQGRARNAAPLDAKVVAIASDAGADQRFAAILRQCPGVEETPRGEAEGVWSVFRIPVDEEIALEVFAVPAGDRWSPIWPLAVHGALATVFVHAEGAENSVPALRASIGAVASAPWTRALHLVLEGKGDGHESGRDAEALCERLGLFDDRSIVSVAPGTGENARKAVRDLIARLLP